MKAKLIVSRQALYLGLKEAYYGRGGRFMKTRLIFYAGLVFSLLSSNVMAEPTVRYLKEEDITKDNLIKILSGQSTEEEIKVRGIKPTDSAGPQATAGSQPPIGSAQPAAAQCGAQQRRTRGIQVVSVSDSAAMA